MMQNILSDQVAAISIWLEVSGDLWGPRKRQHIDTIIG